MAATYGLVYLRSVTDTPDGVTYAQPRRQGALEVTSRRSVWALAALTVPLNAILGVIAWRIWREDVISDGVFVGTLVGIAALLAFQEWTVLRVNRPALRDEYPPEDRYPVRNVAVLCLAYFATFGSELAVVTMLPGFFADTWGLGPAVAGAAASGFAFMNLAARPAGGLLSDILGSRKRTLSTLLVGLVIGYGLMSTLGPAWPWVAAIAVCMSCSFFVQSGEGAVYAIVPLVKKRVSGQVAGMAGAMGNVGAICFLTLNIMVSERVFFLCIAAAALVAVACSRFLVEPENSFGAELLTDGPATAEPVIDLAGPDPADRAPALVD